MARKILAVRRTKKSVRKTKTEEYLVNIKYMGDEPMYSGVVDGIELTKALNWYNYMCTRDDAREYLKAFHEGEKENIKIINAIPDKMFPTTAAWLARIATRGGTLPTKQLLFIENSVLTAAKYKDTVAEDEPHENRVSARPSIQDRVRDRLNDIIGDIEQLIDSGEPFSMYEWLQVNEVPAMYCSKIIEFYKPWLYELVEAFESKDEQLKEAYKMPKRDLKDRIQFFSTMLDDVNKYAGVTKKTKAPRKPRTISLEKQLKKLKYQKEDQTYKVASINPEKIIGAMELWTFNTRYKTITVFRAIDRGGLKIKGTTIVNYDEKNSFTKTTGRKTEEFVDRVMNGGKIILRKLMDELKSDKALQTRINENTILLKVVN